MVSIKRKEMIWLLLLVLGCGYFSAMSNLEMNYYLKSLIALLPMQVAALIYVAYLRWHRS
ncbi:hypothetical protein [Umezakia ovalisporum]|uniref:Uncharacterized protein n=1 Tax=Umezakia ovalisporum FSS-62 TaxID=2971776 RepID=A0AA43KDF6_9CYAN|nr:hypothetical protein [Umezakia ovalisporum]MDH6062220.1 hypothetical protein [Umezakia ovalisporum FSS-62]MDH6103940.1 hypothetical protein [Umezakia ovalisporum ANA283AFssAo]